MEITIHPPFSYGFLYFPMVFLWKSPEGMMCSIHRPHPGHRRPGDRRAGAAGRCAAATCRRLTSDGKMSETDKLGKWRNIYDIWYIMIYYDILWYIMIYYDIWYIIYDIWYMIYDIWYMIYDIWYIYIYICIDINTHIYIYIVTLAHQLMCPQGDNPEGMRSPVWSSGFLQGNIDRRLGDDGHLRWFSVGYGITMAYHRKTHLKWSFTLW